MADPDIPEFTSPVKITLTGATTEVGGLIVFMIARGDLFGPQTPIDLALLTSQEKELHRLNKGTIVELGMCNLQPLKRVRGVMDITEAFQDAQYIILADGVPANAGFRMCNLQPLKRVRGVMDITEAFQDAQYIILADGVPANAGFSRRDLIGTNCREFKDIGIALRAVEKTVKILVVSDPQCVNIEVLLHFAPNLNPKQITGISRVDHNRSVVHLAKMLDVTTNKVTCVSIFGNSGAKVFPDLRHGKVEKFGKQMGLYQAVGDDYYLKYDFVRELHHRNEELYKKCNRGPYLTTANAVIQHMRDWIFGTPEDTWTSMVVLSDGSYGIEEGKPFSFPVRVDPMGHLTIVSDLGLDLFEKERVAEAAEHAAEEKSFAWATMGLVRTQDLEEQAPLTWSFGCNDPVPCRVLGPLERQRMNYF